jgi:nucleoside 2-deoxyribosyltransferase
MRRATGHAKELDPVAPRGPDPVDRDCSCEGEGTRDLRDRGPHRTLSQSGGSDATQEHTMATPTTADPPSNTAPTPRVATTPRVYLAGPMVFDPDPAPTFARMKTICRESGLIGVAPLDNQIGLEQHPPGKPLLERIVRADIDLMDQLDAGVFCLDGFRRGPDMDPGTAFEIGYMKALRKPLAGWTRDPRSYPVKVAEFFRTTFGADLSNAVPNAIGGTSGRSRDPDGVLVHSEDCVQNAMIHIGIELAGGAVVADPNWEHAFRAAIASIARQLGIHPTTSDTYRTNE